MAEIAGAFIKAGDCNLNNEKMIKNLAGLLMAVCEINTGKKLPIETFSSEAKILSETMYDAFKVGFTACKEGKSLQEAMEEFYADGR